MMHDIEYGVFSLEVLFEVNNDCQIKIKLRRKNKRRDQILQSCIVRLPNILMWVGWVDEWKLCVLAVIAHFLSLQGGYKARYETKFFSKVFKVDYRRRNWLSNFKR